MKKVRIVFIFTIAVICIGISLYYAFGVRESGAINEIETRYDHPDLAQLHEFNMTKDPALGYPPRERLSNAKKYQQSYFNKARAIQNVNWTERGPNNVGGRTRAIMFDPNDPLARKVWAGGVTGGLWYNEDITKASTEWQKVDDFNESLAINNIVNDPNNPNIFYFGTGEGWFGQGMIRGKGIWKSENGGETWTVLNSTDENADFSFVQKIAVTSFSTLLVAARDPFGSGGIYRSDDGGATWTKKIDGRGADIEITGDTLYASIGIGTPGQLYRSVDDGENWINITPSGEGGERIEIGVSSASDSVVYAIAGDADGNIAWFYRSSNAGEDWVELNVPKYLSQSSCNQSSEDFTRGQSWYDLIISVHPEDDSLVVVGGIDLHRSFDGGQTWEPISYWAADCEIYVHADQHNFIYRPGHPNEAVITNDGGVYYTKDITVPENEGKPIFEVRNRGYNVTQFYSCATKNEAGSHYFLAGAQDNGSHQFEQVGINATFEITGGDGGFCFIDQDESNIQITSYVFNAYFVTNNEWTQYRDVGSGTQGLFINPTDYNSSTNTLFAAADDGNLFRYKNIHFSNSNNEDLLELGIDQISAISVSPYHEDTVFVGTTTGEVYIVSDATANEVDVTSISNNMVTGYISSIAIGADNQHILITSTSYGVQSVWESVDGGLTWTDKEGNLPDMPIRWALYNPGDNNEVLLATDLGVWSTDDLNSDPPEWEPTNSGLANVRCDMIKYRASDGLTIVATHGRGLYTSDIFVDSAYADFYTVQDVAYEGQPITFIDASVQGEAYGWNFGDGGSSSNPNPTYTFSEAGEYEVTLMVNGDLPSAKARSITVLPVIQADYLLENGGDFESNQTHFKAITEAGSGFELGASDVENKSGTHSGENAWVLAKDNSQYVPYSEALLYSPAFDFSLSGEYILEFHTKYAIEDEWDGFVLEYSIDDGVTWIKLGDYLELDSWYNQIAIGQNQIFQPKKPFFSGSTDGEFLKKSIDISSLSNNDLVAFRFLFRSDAAAQKAGVAIDDFQVFAPDESTPMVSFTSSEDGTCEEDPIIFENESSGNILSYSWDFGAGATPAVIEGYGPHEVFYKGVGTKVIRLSAETSGGIVEYTQEVNVSNKPSDVLVTQGVLEVCEDETLELVVGESEMGVSYVLMDEEEVISDIFSGDGGDLTLTSSTLIPGTRDLFVRAFSNGGCSTDMQLSSYTIYESPIAEIIQDDNDLTTEFVGGEHFQWYLEGELIDGATEISYVPEVTGVYTLEVTVNECAGLSEPFAFEPLNLKSIKESNIYPNPTRGLVTVDMHASGDYIYQVYDVSGSRLLTGEMKYTKEFEIDLSKNRAGVYYIKISSGEGSLVRKIIKQ